jgi:hypothetical protein
MTNQASNQDALTGIRSLAFELIKNSPELERKIKIEDLGDHCTIQLTVRVVKEEFREAYEKVKSFHP